MQALPKVELHIHLERALRLRTVQRIDRDFMPSRYVRELAALPTMPRRDYVARRCAALDVLQSEEALRLAIKDLAQQLTEDGVIYAEIRLAPFLYTRRGLSPENVVRCVVDSLNRAYHDTRLDAHLILCTVHTAPAIESESVAYLVERFQGLRVVGFGLIEDPCSPAPVSDRAWSLETHLPAFTATLEKGLPRVVDADETVSAERLWKMMELYVPRRVGHALPCLHYFGLQDLLRETNTHLELCPARDVQLGLFPDMENYPLDAWYRAGHSLSVSTDGRVTTPFTLSETYEMLQQQCGWRVPEFLACNLMAVDASFAPRETKAKLRARLREAYLPRGRRKRR